MSQEWTRSLASREPVDSDVDLHALRRRRRAHRLDDAHIISMIALGGALGAAARYLVGQQWPTTPGTFPTSTFAINVIGCALIGILMVLVTDVWTRSRLLRPLLGTGLLGGFTTFSTYAVEIQLLTGNGHATTALAYLATTLVAALAAVWTTAALTRRVVNRRLT